MRRLVVPLAVAVLLAGCGWSPAARPRLTVSPSAALVDVPIRIVLAGARPRARVVFRASTVDFIGRRFSSRITAHADAHGSARAPMALLWSMHPARAANGYGDDLQPNGQDITITADGATAHLHWRIRSPAVIEQDLRPSQAGLYADFFRLRSSTRRPAVLLFGGSEGGLSTFLPGLLASRGFPTLSLAYFGAPGRPATLSRIPLEYFEHALRWLARQPGVDPHRLTVYGVSRGSEAALLLGLHDRALVHEVVALVPSDVVVGAYPGCGGPAWTLHGRAIPFQCYAGPVGPATIPVARIEAPLLLDCGGGDGIWPSCEMARAIVQARHGRAVTLLSYPLAGHGIGDLLPNVPQADAETDGFDPLANARARVDAWPKLLRFLAD